MNLRSPFTALAIMLAVTFPTLTATSARAANVELGLLTCDIDAGTGFLIGSRKDLECVFTPADQDAADEWYFGTVSKLGIDIGTTTATVVKWIVLGINIQSLPQGALAGRYGGISASGSLGVGLGVNALIGGSNKGFILQPFSLEGNIGVNLAVGLTGIVLRTED